MGRISSHPSASEIEGMAVPPARSLLRRRGSPGLFLSLIFLIAFLPALWNLGYWDLPESSARWALRSLAVRDGAVWAPHIDQAVGFPDLAVQPPLYAWVTGLVFEVTGPCELGAVLPSYLFGAGAVVMVYLLGELFLGPSVGLLASVLVGLNHLFLVTMQKGDPTTMLLFWIVAAFYFYGRHLKAEPDRFSLWVIPAGLCVAGALMTVGLVALVVPAVVLLHAAYQALAVDRPLRGALRRLVVFWNFAPTMGLLAIVVIGVGLASAWHLDMRGVFGPSFWDRLASPLGRWPPPDPSHGAYEAVAQLIPVYPAILVLGLYGWGRAIRRALKADEDAEVPLWPSAWDGFWLALGLLLVSVWPDQRDRLVLILGVPLCLCAAESLVALNDRRVPLRVLLVLLVLTVGSIVWWQTHAFQTACNSLVASVRNGYVPPLGQAIMFHLFVDVLAGLALLAWILYRWAQTRDRHQLFLLGVLFATVVGVTAGKGMWEVSQVRHQRRDWKLVRRALEARYGRGEMPTVTTFAPGAPTGQMLFAIRSALGRATTRHCRTVEELREALARPGPHAVVVAGHTPSLPHDVLVPQRKRRHVLVRMYGGRSAALYGSPPAADEASARE